MQQFPGRYRFLVHTDRRDLLAADFAGLDVTFKPVLGGSDNHHKMGNCHRDAFVCAELGEYVLPLTADIVLSKECFAAAAQRFEEGKRLIVCAATRCLVRGSEPPIGVDARQLLDWTMSNAHPSVRELFWGTGRSGVPWSLYFKTEHGTVLRGMHLHPFAVVKHAGLSYSGVNIDETLAMEFSTADIHVVVSPDEMALAEISPPDRLFVLFGRLDEKSVFKWALGHTNEWHHWLFKHRIVIQGTDQGTTDIAPCRVILDKLHYARFFCYGKDGKVA